MNRREFLKLGLTLGGLTLGGLAMNADATEKLSALGVKVASNSDGVYLGDERLDPIFAALNEKNSLVIIHPSPAKSLPRTGVVTGKVMALFEYPADTTRAVLNMLANGTLEKFPRLDILLKIASLDKIIFGTDYPYVPAQVVLRKKKFFDEEISRRSWTEKIYVDNARILFGG